METIAFFILVMLVVVLESSLRKKRLESDAVVTETDEQNRHTPVGGKYKMVVGGVILPILIAAWGVYSIISGAFVFPNLGAVIGGNPRLWDSMIGSDAVILGVGFIGLAFFLHFDWFWRLHPKLSQINYAPGIIALLVLILCLAWMFFNLLAMIWSA